MNTRPNQSQRISNQNASQIISKLRNSQNQSLNSVVKTNQGYNARNMLVIPQNAMVSHQGAP